MHLNISQQMRMSQQMKLAPRMIQSMESSSPVAALQERIEQELSENVALEQVTADPDAAGREQRAGRYGRARAAKSKNAN